MDDGTDSGGDRPAEWWPPRALRAPGMAVRQRNSEFFKPRGMCRYLITQEQYRHSFDTGGAHRPQALSRHGRRAGSVETESTARRDRWYEFPINLVSPFRDASNYAIERSIGTPICTCIRRCTDRFRSAVAFLIGPLRWEYKACAAELSSASAVSYGTWVHCCVERVKIPFCPSCPIRHIGECNRATVATIAVDAPIAL